jgi:UPF0755 protein
MPTDPKQNNRPLTKGDSRGWKVITGVVGAFIILLIGITLAAYILNKAPANQTLPNSFTVEPGMSVKSITSGLEQARIVKSDTFLYFVLSLFYNTRDIKASTYVFDKPLTTFAVASKLVAGDFDTDLIKFTHVEGESVAAVAKEATIQLENFNETYFLEKAKPLEGTLYPETYYIPKSFTADELLTLMTKTFTEKTADLTDKISASNLSQKEILVLASILEREANSPESMKMVSDILQRRLAEGMPLQADASIEYVLNKPLKELTPDDLKVDSPYNTYTNRGLPPTPIGNPGREAILAVLEPSPNSFVFYITDNEGVFHYAVTYDEHRANIAKYLK